MKCSKFITLITCFLNVPVTLSLVYLVKPQPPTPYLSSTSKVNQQQICYDTFSLRTKHIMTEIKNNTKDCMNTGDLNNINNCMNTPDLNNIKDCMNTADLKFQINKKVELLRGLTLECAVEKDLVEYFACIKRTKSNNEKLLSEILLLTDIFSKNIKQIEQNKTACFIEAIEKGKYKRRSAQYDLNLCLQNTKRQDGPLSFAQSEYSSNNDTSEFSNIKNRLITMYGSLASCIRSGEENKTCWGQMALEEEISGNPINKRPYIYENISNNFDEFTKLDKSENTCLRQFIATYTSSSYNFDLDECLLNDSSSVIQSEENEDKDIGLVNKMKNLHIAFDACRAITKDLDTQRCIFDTTDNNSLYSEIQGEIATRSDEKLNKIIEISKDLYSQKLPCIDNLFKAIQFNGINLKPIEKGQLLDCLKKGFKTPNISEITKDVVLEDLKNIQNTIQYCTLHPDSPGFKKCFSNTAMVFGGNILYITTKYENYKELVDESDKNNQTCYGSILENAQSSNEDLTQLENCILKF
ncbi:uncharacterized protein LOC129939797 isoform X2 [Eupeodes corollae]|uniref:uncharacterized protein LOC129939797 isoform X2 n=1 Tax=Eupeodes corollae TaxID=290404 RepID=UPI002493C2D2|nr:uncharacterized protein LOC129939797 isoform X2 [Eupeodes corollae]